MAIKHISKPTKEHLEKNKKFKIAISYPPMPSKKGTPCLGQNRQFQWFKNPTYIYPMVPAYVATLLQLQGFDVLWDDGIAEELLPEIWLDRIKKFRPDLIIFETKTPVVKRHWKVIDVIKKEMPAVKVVLVGDHVTAMPEESMKNSKVDFIATGGDWDFLALNIANHINHGEKLEAGIWFRKIKDQKSKIPTGSAIARKMKEGDLFENTGHFELNHILDELPMIDRDLTKWKLYAYKNGNYKRTPGTYTFSARDCWWGKCTFCSWTTLYPGKDYRKHSAKRMLDEIGILIHKYKVKEVMDDAGSFPIGPWLEEFCDGMISRGYNKKIKIDCNMRLKALSQEEYNLMGKAGFRFILYGLESANQKTLDHINKNLRVAEIEKGVRMAKKAGLEPHITTMMGYPWESLEDAKRTIALSKKLFDSGFVDTLQATIVIPYPGTPLFKECQKNGWLTTKNWDDYDQRKIIMKSELSESDIKELTQGLYKSFMTPKFIFRKIGGIRSADDLKFLWRAGGKLLGHLTDFSKKKT
ncbi:MAG: radical SAM protein [Candidatus Berkelbacteria bacterium]|nr:radical SAM protein [Candidatus Berkelbacteria bacterium]